ncbi:MED14-domain-containing protein [Nadsonia fulvescens var. elongata DSM 6958]|uniref:Mediator of RNA polymerase II transcription subunit 14 n=1 Tax=Nadsonia fulvescens var. elongata DSM 6958 TaxID=857566 RepID=A0A1E3PIR1_9ASCO|nr:MED14-domain-containing protein [Nadsonia fulvescens var. elongata DSM 6958]
MSTLSKDETSIVVKKKINQTNSSPPPIPHITQNYIPLSHVINNFVQYTYSELQHILETLPSNGSDDNKKMKLLEFIINSRKEFVKIYVLTKWAKVTKDISKCIDIVAWLNGQRNCFDNVINALYGIERTLGGAKLRNPDISTALDVLSLGHPTANLFNFVPPKPLTPQLILSTLHDLNVLLTIRLALIPDLPEEFQHYKIANGRATFSIHNAFDIDIGIADESSDAAFFLIDFRFTFNGAQAVSTNIKAKLEMRSNEVLARHGLRGLFNTLMIFTNNYKLSVLHKELLVLRNGLWTGVISVFFNTDRSHLILHYWIHRPGGRNIIELGLSKSNSLSLRWTREGKVVNDFDLSAEISDQIQDRLSAEWLLERITSLHLEHIISSTNIELLALLNLPDDSPDTSANNKGNRNILYDASKITIVGANDKKRLKIRLTSSRYTVFTVDQLTGRSVLENPNNLTISAERSLNELTEDHHGAAEVIFKLRLISLQDEIRARACATGWINNVSIHLSSDDIRYHFGQSTKFILYLRQPKWPLGSFILVTLGGNIMPRWWISQLSPKGESWTINFLEQIVVRQNIDAVYDYKLFDKLVQFATSRIAIHSICLQLKAYDIQYKRLKDIQGNPIVSLDTTSIAKSTWAHNLMFLQLAADSEKNTVFLVQGKVKSLSNLCDIPSSDPSIILNPKLGTFAIKVVATDFMSNVLTNIDAPKLVTRTPGHVATMPADKENAKLISSTPTTEKFATGGIIQIIRNKLAQVERVVSYVDLIRASKLALSEVSMNRLSFNYGSEPSLAASIILSDINTMSDKFLADENIQLVLNKESPHRFIQAYLQSILNLKGLKPIIWILTTTLNLYQAILKVSQLHEAKFNEADFTAVVDGLDYHDLELKKGHVTIIHRNATTLRLIYKDICTIDIKLVHKSPSELVYYITQDKLIVNKQFQQNSQIPILTGTMGQFDINCNRKLEEVWQGIHKLNILNPDSKGTNDSNNQSSLSPLMPLDKGIVCQPAFIGSFVEEIDKLITTFINPVLNFDIVKAE